TTPPCTGTAPPAKPLPPPRGTIGSARSQHHATTARTSSVLAGSTTASGRPSTPWDSVASRPQRRSAGSPTPASPTSARRSAVRAAVMRATLGRGRRPAAGAPLRQHEVIAVNRLFVAVREQLARFLRLQAHHAAQVSRRAARDPLPDRAAGV